MSGSERPSYFPMMIDLKGRKVLVVGGGNVASRRAGKLLLCGAEVVAVSPEFVPDFPGGAERITRQFQAGDITGNLALVVAATDDRETNKLIHDTANSMGIPVNVSDCQDECDFFFPSLIISGSVAVSVCSAGTSPELTRRLSDHLREVWPSWVEEEGGYLRPKNEKIH